MGASGHPGDAEGSASVGDFVDDLVCTLTHAKVAGKPVCIGCVPVPPGSAPRGILMHCAVLVTIGVVPSAGRQDVVAPTFSRVSSPSLFP